MKHVNAVYLALIGESHVKKLVALALILIPTTVFANTQNYGAWVFTTITKGDAYIVTTNDAGDQLGVLCSNQKCGVFLKTSNSCSAGSSTVAISETDAPNSAASFILNCIVENDGTSEGLAYSTPLINSMLNKSATSVGVVVPLNGGEFAVKRFSLLGFLSAVQNLSAAIQNKKSQDEIL